MPNFNMDSISDYVKNHPYETAAGVAGAVATPALAYKYKNNLVNLYYRHKANEHAKQVLNKASQGILGTSEATQAERQAINAYVNGIHKNITDNISKTAAFNPLATVRNVARNYAAKNLNNHARMMADVRAQLALGKAQTGILGSSAPEFDGGAGWDNIRRLYNIPRVKHASMEKLAHEEIVAYLADMKGVDFEKVARKFSRKFQRLMTRKQQQMTRNLPHSTTNASPKPQQQPTNQAPTKTIKSPETQQKPQPQQPQQSQQPQQQSENKGFAFSKRTKTLATLGAAAGGTGAVVGHMVGGKSDNK